MYLLFAWLVCMVCTYLILIKRLDVVTKRWGGFTEFMLVIAEKGDPEMRVMPPNLFQPVLRTILMITCLFAWPLVLLWIGKTYCVDQVAECEKYMKKKMED